MKNFSRGYIPNFEGGASLPDKMDSSRRKASRSWDKTGHFPGQSRKGFQAMRWSMGGNQGYFARDWKNFATGGESYPIGLSSETAKALTGAGAISGTAEEKRGQRADWEEAINNPQLREKYLWFKSPQDARMSEDIYTALAANKTRAENGIKAKPLPHEEGLGFFNRGLPFSEPINLKERKETLHEHAVRLNMGYHRAANPKMSDEDAHAAAQNQGELDKIIPKLKKNRVGQYEERP